MKRSSVTAIILNSSEEVLLLKRHPHDRTLPDVYCLPGGKIDTDEFPLAALKREVFEETKLEVVDHTFLCKGENEKFNILFFTVRVKNTSPVTISNEHESYAWIPLTEAFSRGDVPPATQKALKELLLQIH